MHSVLLQSIGISNPVYSQIFKIISCIHPTNKPVHSFPPAPLPATHVSYLNPHHLIAIITFYGIKFMEWPWIAQSV